MKSLKIWLVNVSNWQVVEHCGDIALAREVQKLYGAGWDICTNECRTKYPDGVIFMDGVLYSTKQPK